MSRMAAGINPVDRVIRFHPCTSYDLFALLAEAGRLIAPSALPDLIRALLGAAVLLGLLVGAGATGSPGPMRARSNSALFVLSAITLGYLGFLVAVRVMIDRGLSLDARMLIPVFPLVVAVMMNLAALRSGWVAKAALFAVWAVMAMNISRSLIVARADERLGYASRQWRSSPAIALVETLPIGTRLYSNGWDALWFLTGRPAEPVPVTYSPSSGDRIPTDWSAVTEVREGRGIVVWFHSVKWRPYLVSESELATKLGVCRAFLGSGVVVFAACGR